MMRINSIFRTLQGEGFQAGRPATFIRLAHCNLDCSWCDTEYNTYTNKHLEDLARELEPRDFFVVTGGEPFLNRSTLLSLVSFLIDRKKAKTVAIESNGTLPPHKSLINLSEHIFLTISPKEQQKTPYFVHPEIKPLVSEVKLVVDKSLRDNQKKLLSLMSELEKVGRFHYLSPEFNELDRNAKAIYNLIEKQEVWKLSLQTHKWIGLP